MKPSGQMDPNTLLEQAVLFRNAGNWAKAAANYRQLIKQFPKHAQLLSDLGTIELHRGNLEEGVRLLGTSLEIEPNNPMALSNRSMGLKNLNRLEEAVVCADRAVALQPGWADAHNSRGTVLHDLLRFDAAIESFDRAIKLQPDHAAAHSNRGLALHKQKRFEDAIESFNRAIRLQPQVAFLYNNRALSLQEIGRFEDALASYDRALTLNPDYPDALCNRGVLLASMRRFDEANSSYDRAIKLQKNYALANWNKALLELTAGNFKNGLELFEWRWRCVQKGLGRNFKRPLWLGGKSIANKTLLVHMEQGLGDYIQVCRYIPMLAEKGAKVVLEVPSPLASLVSTLKGDFKMVREGQPLPAFDVFCPIMSLPLAFKTTATSIPAPVPYLFADVEKQRDWHMRLGEKTRPRIGLAWSGNATHINDRNRSIPFRLLAPLLKLPVDFHVLQKEIRANDAADIPHHMNIHQHQGELNDFSDTAALLQEMDLMITVDTSVAHLAGAMGKKTWILLPYVPDYRWMMDRADSPWYPTATLFRQSAIGDWPAVIAEVAARLRSLVEAGGL